MSKEEFRLSILKKVETGEINLETASRLLSEVEKLDEGIKTEIPIDNVDVLSSSEILSKEIPGRPAWGNLFWILPLIIGMLITSFSAYWLYQSYQNSGLGFWFWFSFIPLAFGIFLIYFAWILDQARWLHILIRQPKGEKPERIILGFPLPINFALFIIRTFKIRIPGKFENDQLEDMLHSIDSQINKEDPVFINVDDEDGTKVEIYIG